MAAAVCELAPHGANERVLVSVVGVPGSGKTTLSEQLVVEVNRAAKSGVCCVVPMDGFHLPKKALDAMADPVEAHRRRGAPFTFDPEGLLDMVKRIKTAGDQEVVKGPGWDHSVGDPLQDAIQVLPRYVCACTCTATWLSGCGDSVEGVERFFPPCSFRLKATGLWFWRACTSTWTSQYGVRSVSRCQ